ncbi:hypothetical protein DFH28DRAFT_1128149 [Melampsora americana]|nr:hypothetical protein DFH28DRAFT_1128149 [Melampsora americana]
MSNSTVTVKCKVHLSRRNLLGILPGDSEQWESRLKVPQPDLLDTIEKIPLLNLSPLELERKFRTSYYQDILDNNPQGPGWLSHNKYGLIMATLEPFPSDFDYNKLLDLMNMLVEDFDFPAPTFVDLSEDMDMAMVVFHDLSNASKLQLDMAKWELDNCDYNLLDKHIPPSFATGGNKELLLQPLCLSFVHSCYLTSSVLGIKL